MLTQELVRKLFDYNPDTGHLIRKTKTANCVKVGDICGCITKEGYISLGINGKRYLAHRVIFLHVFGFLPKMIDHVNGVGVDNRLCNLRECTAKQNQRNRKLSKNNKSGVKGVHFDNASKKWVAFLSIGSFEDLEEAKKEVEKARDMFHGDFSNHG